jgi:hypothetical protein
VAIKLFCREEAQKDAKKEKSKNMLRVMICWLRVFVNFVLFCGYRQLKQAGNESLFFY